MWAGTLGRIQKAKTSKLWGQKINHQAESIKNCKAENNLIAEMYQIYAIVSWLVNSRLL